MPHAARVCALTSNAAEQNEKSPHGDNQINHYFDDARDHEA